MTSINTSLASYYPLTEQSSSNTSNLLSGSSSSVTALAQALEQADSSNNSSNSDAYLLNLSPQAQTILNGGSNSATSSSSSSSNFTLSSVQQSTINSILEKYKNSPFNQATFDDIQNDLSAAGLSPTQLSAKDEIQSFNPTQVFLGALDGNDSNLANPTTTLSNEQTKASNYIQSIISAWQSISTTATSDSDSSTATS